MAELDPAFKRLDKDVSVAYVSRCEKDPSFDTIENAIKDGYLISDEEFDALGIKRARALYRVLLENSRDDTASGDESAKKN